MTGPAMVLSALAEQVVCLRILIYFAERNSNFSDRVLTRGCCMEEDVQRSAKSKSGCANSTMKGLLSTQKLHMKVFVVTKGSCFRANVCRLKFVQPSVGLVSSCLSS